MVRSRVKELKDLLVNSLGDDFEIIEENYKLLTPPGEHYGSIMLALEILIKLRGKKEIFHLVAKIVPASQMLRTVFNIGVTFKKEVSAYLTAIPALIELQKEYNVPENKILDMFPTCYGARISLNENKNEVDDNAVLLFENLKVHGYVMEDRMVGFDLEHAKLIVKDLARFHSVSIALRLLKPKTFTEKIEPSIGEGPALRLLPQSFIDCILDHSALIDELNPYVPKLRKFIEKSLNELKKPIVRCDSVFSTLIHSDYWVNNTMVLRDRNGNPIKNKIVDLQLMSYNSSVGDLLFFLFTSVINSVLEKHYDELIKVYYDAFIDSIKYFDLDMKQFSWNTYMNEIEAVAPMEAYHIVVMLKPIFTERNKITNTLEDFQDSDWNREDLLGEAYRRKLKNTVVELVKRNWI